MAQTGDRAPVVRARSDITKVLVTGGAGYIGSHVCKALRQAGFEPVTYDNLSRGHRDLVRWGPFEEGDIRDAARLDDVTDRHRPAAVIHLAAFAYIGESMSNPLLYYDNNVYGSLELLKAMARAGIAHLVFSSTCAVYGIPAEVPISESSEPRPINPYGQSKLTVERMICAQAAIGPMTYAVLRYFNAAGADADGDTGERHDPEPHLIPTVIERVMNGLPVGVFGDDYPTQDGTCVRDYIHVSDLADAHVRAVRHLLDRGGSLTVNLGTGRGHSVLEITRKVGQLVAREPVIERLVRRPGDPPYLVAKLNQAKDILGWSPRYSDLDTILRSAVAWHRRMSP